MVLLPPKVRPEVPMHPREISEQERQRWQAQGRRDFFEALRNATTEEEVKVAYIQEFKLSGDMGQKIDLRVGSLLFEYKRDVDFQSVEVSAKVLAQALYYVHRLWKNGEDSEITQVLLVDRNEVRIFERNDFSLYYRSERYDWRLKPSDPDSVLIQDLIRSELIYCNKCLHLGNPNEFELFKALFYSHLNSTIPTQAIDVSKSNKNRRLYWASAAMVLLSGALSLGLVMQRQQPTPTVIPANISQP